jgi:hypothetical protein
MSVHSSENVYIQVQSTQAFYLKFNFASLNLLYITYNSVAVDFTSNICRRTYPVAVLQTAE